MENILTSLKSILETQIPFLKNNLPSRFFSDNVVNSKCVQKWPSNQLQESSLISELSVNNREVLKCLKEER